MGVRLSKSQLAATSHVFPKFISFILTWKTILTYGFSLTQRQWLEQEL